MNRVAAVREPIDGGQNGSSSGTLPFVYPSKLPILKKTTMVTGFVWLGVMIAYVVAPKLGEMWLLISFAYPIYYFTLSFVMYPRLKRDAREAD